MTEERSKKQAALQLQHISEMVTELETAQNTDDDTRVDNARRTIQDDALSVEVRGRWHLPDEHGDEEYNILLRAGSPAVRIIGDLNQYEPENAAFEHHDRRTSWTNYPLTKEEEKTLLTYARQFYFGYRD